MTGNDLISLEKKHIGEKYVFGALAPKAQKDYKGPWDCAEFQTWGIYQLSGKLYGCANNNGNPNSADAYTGFWGRDAEALGKKITINEAYSIPGAMLLRLGGEGIIGHIVCSQGNGKTIEAHSTKTGVIENVISGRRWDFGILVFPSLISYNLNTVPVVNEKPSGVIYRFTSPAMKGKEIERIQKVLGLPVDGIFGHGTFNAVRAFQLQHGLVADGEVGPKTLAALWGNKIVFSS